MGTMRSLRLGLLLGFAFLFSFVSAQCPAYNATTYVDTSGNSSWSMYCGTDSQPGAYNTVTSNVYTLDDCMLLCDGDTKCTGVSFQAGSGSASGTCYMKNTVSAHTGSTTLNSATKLPKYPPPPANNANSSTGCSVGALPPGVVAGGGTTSFNFTTPDGLVRNYNIHVPYLYNASVAAPVIMAFHGASDSAVNIESSTGWSLEATNPYAIAVYPNGQNVSG